MRLKPALLILPLVVGITAGSFSPYPGKDLTHEQEPQNSFLNSAPPEPIGEVKGIVTYEAVALPYSYQEIILKVEGAMILAPVNKLYALPSWYVPPSLVSLTGEVKTIGAETLRREILPHLKGLITAAEKSCSTSISVLSAYRSYQTQASVYNYWVAKVGQQSADLGSARPGHSEHQLGTTVDLTSASVGYQLTREFGNTKEGRWLKENAHRWGFVLSYPEGKTEITGYVWEPWHFRYLGKEVATKIYQKGVTPEEFLLRN
jgi:D-alanyl-D-alanine carboxypeptidase